MKKTNTKQIQNLVKDCFIEGKLDNSKVSKILKVAKTMPQSQSLEFLTSFLNLLKLELNKMTLVIKTPIPLSAKIKLEIEKKLTKDYKINSIEEIIDKSILGGFICQIGDTVYDFSLKNKINQVKETIYA